ncbi:Two-component signal transduction system YycFG, regulatory protein YycI [Carnobacterium iners]|uniref:Two-component signal transduction system YycFG, regulatory protein YycI n=1 Tax=Carnobacterium iners TaxID=1073423 RepID=A0A1X7MRE9_9LACT|nr:two-component system regulatory protein YycI [Carnobacterium iners]SEK75001.1 Two-component signal transduction system YycFG, regulatory protein YycI [Carnobacterium iners]SMH27400.1 Two-component signal transduction system YycFG, regulatory protein YycI [Carnobacterium iners]
MDFKRIEIIFVLTFLALNAFLLSTYFDKNYNDFSSNSSNSEVNFIEEMSKSNIELPTFQDEKNKVPYVQSEANRLLAESYSLANQVDIIEEKGSIFSSILSSPILLTEEKEFNAKDIEKLTSYVKNNQVLFDKDYQFFRYIKNSQQVIFTQIANNIPIADGTSEVIFHLDNSKRVISYEQSYAGPVTVQGESRELITDKSAVGILYQNNEIPADTIVKKPVLSYYRTLDLEELSMYAPAWFIEIESSTDTQVKRIDAINGTLLKVPTLEQPQSTTKNRLKPSNESDSSNPSSTNDSSSRKE